MDNPPTNASEKSGLNPKCLEESVIQGFEKLARKIQQMLNQHVTRTVPVDAVDSRETLHYRLQSALLPLLNDQLATLLTFLDHSSMKNEPESKLERILEIQPELEHNITQIHSDILVICPESLSNSSQTDDQLLKGFKVYMLLELKKKWHHVSGVLLHAFSRAADCIQDMELSTGGSSDMSREFSPCRYWILQAIDFIKLTSRYLNESELDIVEDSGKEPTAKIVGLLDRNIILAKHDLPLPPSQCRFAHQPAFHLACLARVLLQLSRLFFKKLSRHEMNSHTFPLSTQMNSDQLEALCQLAENVLADHRDIENLIYYADDHIEEGVPIDAQALTHKAELLASRFEGPLLCVFSYLVPLIESLPDRDYYRDWFDTWNFLLKLAVHNFVQAAETLPSLEFPAYY
ncbi:hypothetical protein PTTG_29070 [Puccinia triticina 1-1 BBBD Race 1]|uniref:Uncharacterized protein n=1 Tax=Puccinia triticina (isolate 1-1 / race 1 (BBBD)) TaxID=630390 RepID=A0A180G767_PUCT1|nr:hypothetical protein PTTG_29070 [Puccinia triticina 1-1 BBBD Race 1]